MTRPVAAFLAAALLVPAPLLLAQEKPEKVDLVAITKIRDEGLNRSKVMELAAELTDEVGARLTGSPSYRKGAEWARKKLEGFGLVNAHVEPFPFGQGWQMSRVAMHVVAPSTFPVHALPKAWTPGTNGPKKAKAILAKIETEDDLAKWKGKLEGKAVLLEAPKEWKARKEPESQRYDEKELLELEQIEVGAGPGRRGDREGFLKRYRLQRKLRAFLVEEKAAFEVSGSRGDYGTIFVQGGGSQHKEEPVGIPSVVIPLESYGRIARLVEKKIDVEIELDVQAEVLAEDAQNAVDVVAEIPGTDRAAEVVMLGGHLDSWHGGTGATDDGAGVLVAMEAVRILKAAGLKPRRTVRVALWGGEEQGLLGSRDYVSRHFASRADNPEARDRELPAYMRRPSGPITFKPEHKGLSAYFNLDNGTGKIRGIYTQSNAATQPIFEAWIAPFRDLGVTTVTNRNTFGTDHQSFDAVGLPGFQFIQDEMDYETRTHHSDMDVFERLSRPDLMQASVVMAAFVYQAANRDELLPRKAIPPDPPAEERKPGEGRPEKPSEKPSEKAAPVPPAAR